MATPTTRKKAAGARTVSPTPARPGGPSQREKDLETALVAAALANGGELVISYEHAGAATMRPDILGVHLQYTAKGLTVQVQTELDDDEPDPVAVVADQVDYSANTADPTPVSDPTPAYAGYGS